MLMAQNNWRLLKAGCGLGRPAEGQGTELASALCARVILNGDISQSVLMHLIGGQSWWGLLVGKGWGCPSPSKDASGPQCHQCPG